MAPIITLLVVPAVVAASWMAAPRLREHANALRQARQAHRIRPGALRWWFESRRARLALDSMRLSERHKRLGDCAGRLQQLARSILVALSGGTDAPVWTIAAAVVVGGAWAIAAVLEVNIDWASFEGIGYSAAMAVMLAALLTLGFSLAGLALSDLLGLTHLVPGVGRLRRPVRAAAIVYCVIALVLGMTQLLPPIVAHRSESTALRVATLQQNLADVKSIPNDSLAKADLHEQLALARSQLRTARVTDPTIAAVAAGAEAATSWGAVWLTMLITAGSLWALGASVRHGARVAERRRDEAPQRLWDSTIRRGSGRGYTPEGFRRELQPPGLSPPRDPEPSTSEPHDTEQPKPASTNGSGPATADKPPAEPTQSARNVDSPEFDGRTPEPSAREPPERMSPNGSGSTSASGPAGEPDRPAPDNDAPMPDAGPAGWSDL